MKVGVRRGRELECVSVGFFELSGELNGFRLRCGDSAVKWNGIGGVSEVNEIAVHLVWNDFKSMTGMFQQG